MYPEIVFLGTAGHKSVLGKRSGAGTLIKSDKIISIDPGPGALVDLIKAGYSPNKIEAVITSKNEINRNHDSKAIAWAANVFDKKEFILNNENFINQKQFGNISITPIPLKDSLAISIRLPDSSIIYSPVCTKLPEADIIILAGKPDKKHFNKLKAKVIILTHFDDLQEDAFYLARELSNNIKVISAKDGLVVSPLDYSATASQKSLFKY